MSEMQWVTLHVAYPTRWWDPEGMADETAPWFLHVIDDLSFELFDAGTHGEMAIISAHGEFNYGTSQDDLSQLLDDLVTDRIPFIVREDAKYELPATWWLYNGFESYDGNGSEQALLDKATFDSIVAGTSKYRSVGDYFNYGNRSPDQLNVDHLDGDYDSESPGDRDISQRIADNIINGNLSHAREQFTDVTPIQVLDVVQKLHDAGDGFGRAIGRVAAVLNGQS